MYIELHFLQNFAPSNLNRDDTNNPKDTDFGGVRRLRISSQCLKRTIRLDAAFQTATGVDNGTRTKYLADKLLLPRLTEAGKKEEEA
ncbi:MAG: type I-E CRISPR-associated protein Cas7/Cse4/CasC, partial [Burkholderiales bacterium]